MDLKTAPLDVRKASALRGIRAGEWESLFDTTDGVDKILGIVSNARTSEIIRAGDCEYAGAFTWAEIDMARGI